ncbi:MAG: MBL fold metallo-hydrolase [Actinomycetota bacterium]|nr:MBL fold metallo-hydrolase [Actinomycetota bacterium]MDG1489257.1 MBL fold metallo-hydrolase [Actinomycetota bacterium]MDG2120499.1 MBL fold metallo-hydrolase [Actinomycetota bacterium]
MNLSVREEQQPPDEKVVEIAKNIRRLQLPMSMPGLGHVNCYILDDKNGAALVDPGLPGPQNWKALMAGLKQAELPPERVHSIIITHSHPDHFGASGHFREQFGADIITHKNFKLWWDTADEDDDLVESVDKDGDNSEILDNPLFLNRETGPRAPTPWGGKRYKMPLHKRLAYSFMKHGWGGRWFATPQPTSHLEDADHISLAGREFVAIHTPGHTPDHLCLYDPEEEVMICGDHVLPTITPHISGMGTALDPLKDFFTSLDRVKEFNSVKLGLPAHGQPFTDLPGRVTDIKRHHEERLQLLRDSSDRLGRAPVNHYMKELFKERSWGPMAESETFAHLEHLRYVGETDATRNNAGAIEYSFR